MNNDDRFGFTWGPMKVTRMAVIDHGKRGSCHILRVNNLEIYVSKTGRSIRVYKDGRELK